MRITSLIKYIKMDTSGSHLKRAQNIENSILSARTSNLRINIWILFMKKMAKFEGHFITPLDSKIN